MIHLIDQPAKLDEWLQSQAQPKFRSRQIIEWLYRHRAADFSAMTSLPQKLREALAETFTLWTAQVAKHSTSEDGTEKLLLSLRDGGQIECVLLRDGDRRSICISTQVGCAMGCVFCASGLDGVERNLSTGEIIEQMLLLQRLLPDDERLSHIVVMGMGEPLANVDNLLPALDVASAEWGLNISARKITISTVGLPPAMDKLTAKNSRYHLAVSLHAPNDELRNDLVPVNKNIGLQKIIAAADHYFEVSGRRLTFEYVLLADINDGVEHAEELVRLLGGRGVLLNIIPYNPVAGLPYRTPSAGAAQSFREVLEKAGVNVRFRQRKGDKINAACGQLRRSSKDQLTPLNLPTQT